MTLFLTSSSLISLWTMSMKRFFSNLRAHLTSSLFVKINLQFLCKNWAFIFYESDEVLWTWKCFVYSFQILVLVRYSVPQLYTFLLVYGRRWKPVHRQTYAIRQFYDHRLHVLRRNWTFKFLWKVEVPFFRTDGVVWSWKRFTCRIHRMLMVIVSNGCKCCFQCSISMKFLSMIIWLHLFCERWRVDFFS